ncbi:MAG TPA: hypothetical protein VF756_14895 [Thermoanaerobaculia bacterium]
MRDLDYSSVWDRLEERAPALVEEALRRRSEADKLMDELMGEPVERRRALLDEARFQTYDLVESLLEESQAAQIQDPERAVQSAEAAACLAAHLPEDEYPVGSAVARAGYLWGNALRLAGAWEAADRVFADAASSLDDPFDRAVFCRGLALLRWEQGRLDEAMALLHHASSLFEEDELAAESADCLLLLGLIHAERGDPCQALFPLLCARATADPGLRPWLSVRAGFTLAACYAEIGETKKARAALADTVRLYPLVRDADEVLCAFRLEAHVRARVGDPREAENLLEGLRRKLAEQSRVPELALVSIDLALVLAESGREGEIGRMAEEIESRNFARPGGDLAAHALRKLATEIRLGRDPRATAVNAATHLRRTLRSRGLRVEPLPFA